MKNRDGGHGACGVNGSPGEQSAPSQVRRLEGAERLAGLGFRCWLAGYQNNAMTFWEDAWNLYAHELGPVSARAAICDLSAWVRALSGNARRPITLYPAACDRFTHDECLAVSMIAAAQHNCPAIRACAFALLGAQPLDEVITSASRFAARLSENQMMLGPSPIVDPLATPQISARGYVQ